MARHATMSIEAENVDTEVLGTDKYVSRSAAFRELHARIDIESQDQCICRHCVYFGSRRKNGAPLLKVSGL